jgi:retron-type reverse transcriptase
MAAVEERICDQQVLKLLRAMLRAGIMEDGQIRRDTAGTAQGGVIGPVMCNVYLHRLDREWDERAGQGDTSSGPGRAVRRQVRRGLRRRGDKGAAHGTAVTADERLCRARHTDNPGRVPDRMLITGQRHLRCILADYIEHCNTGRAHRALNLRARLATRPSRRSPHTRSRAYPYSVASSTCTRQ